MKARNIFAKDGYIIFIDKRTDYIKKYINTLEKKTFHILKKISNTIIEKYLS